LEDRLAEIPKNLPVVAHCQSGGRSARATEILRRHGYQAHNLIGGIRAWSQR
jgi:adenylyltransferase/sulfurtransferase